MMYFLRFTFISLLAFLTYSKACKLVCYYDTSSPSKVGPAKFTAKDMELALNFCTHVIYSYVTIIPQQFSITAITPEREHELASMKNFKNKFPNIKFLLSLSGESNWNTRKLFLSLLEADPHKRKTFIRSIMNFIKIYKFDGLSLDIPLPTVKPIPHRSFLGKLWFYFKNLFKHNSEENDFIPSIHKSQLTTLIQQLSANIKDIKGVLSLNVLPNVDSGKYFDIVEIVENLDFVVLSAFDFNTPYRNPKEANLMSTTKPAKTQESNNDDSSLDSVKELYKYFHDLSVPRHKIIVGVAAFGRAWKMTKQSNSNGIPPVLYTDGPAPAGPQTQTSGFLSWPEICYKLAHDPKMSRASDTKSKAGVYAFRPANSRGDFGIWISYEDPVTASTKAMYVRNHNLGGVSLFELSLDDVHGECSGEKFPILRSIKFRLTN